MRAFVRRSTAGVDTKDFIAAWEVTKDKAEANGFEMGGNSDAFFLLEALGISDQQRALVHVATQGSCDLKQIAMQVKRPFSSAFRGDGSALMVDEDDDAVYF
eukprot:4034279-Heterocapsa_arctica.AAC.1